jgi:hypothetical protein
LVFSVHPRLQIAKHKIALLWALHTRCRPEITGRRIPGLHFVGTGDIQAIANATVSRLKVGEFLITRRLKSPDFARHKVLRDAVRLGQLFGADRKKL